MALLANMSVRRACKVFALPAITLAIAFCNSEGGSGAGASNSTTATGTGGASSDTAVGTFVGAGGSIFTSTAGASGTGGQGGGPEISVADAGIPDGDVPPEPVVTCDQAADAGDADICPLPPPTCAAGRWIVYYKNPECVDGLCHFEAFAYDCGPIQECVNDGCEYNFTA